MVTLHCGWLGEPGVVVVGDSADVRFVGGVVGWFLAFSTCSWNALSEQALHQSCEAVGVDAAKQRCVETACLQGSSGWGIARGQLRGTTQNRGAPRKDEGNNTAER